MARKPQNRELANLVLIFCEGKTEVNYFKMLVQKYNKGNVKINPVSIKGQALSLVQKVIRIQNEYVKPSEKVVKKYIVFDKDGEYKIFCVNRKKEVPSVE